MEELDHNAEQRRETFAHYGLAMYHAQCVEKSLAILISTVLNKEFPHSNPDRRDAMMDEALEKTIGRLLKRLRSKISVPPNLDKNLENAREKRNWLAHDFFWDRAGKLLTSKGRNSLIDELTSLSDFFLKVDAHLTSIYEKWMIKAGVDTSVIEQKHQRLIKENE
jgi:hypothetical protein